MSLYNPVVWQDGMFMKAQHFQQLERFQSKHASSLSSFCNPLFWGVSRIEINSALLKLGKIGITRAEGILQDRTPFSLPLDAEVPDVRNVDTSIVDTTVYLCCPLPSERAEQFGVTNDGARYSSHQQQVTDCNYDNQDTTSLEVGQLNFRLMFENEDMSSYTAIPIFKISEVKSDGYVILDSGFIPTCLDIQASEVVKKFTAEFASLLRHRAESIVSRLGVVDQQGVSSVADFMLLQAINRLEPLFWHLKQTEGIHPEAFYRILLQAQGELSTLCSSSKRPNEYVSYNHTHLTECITPYLHSIRSALSVMSEQRAVPLVLREQNYGIRIAALTDSKLVESATMILAVKADVTLDVLHTRFVTQTKIGSMENIRDLVNLQLPGVTIRPMPVVPRQLPYHEGYTYFELERGGDEWQALTKSAGIAVHVAGEFSNLSLQLWAVRL